MLPLDFQVIPVQTSDAQLVLDYLGDAQYAFRHLDWRLPVDWLGAQPYLLALQNQKPTAMVICPDSGEKHSWLRHYSGLTLDSAKNAWPSLLDECKKRLTAKDVDNIFSIALAEWYEDLLSAEGFELDNHVIVLEKSTWQTKPLRLSPTEFLVTPMISSDMEEVFELDQECFDPVWQITEQDIHIAFRLSDNCSIARDDDHKIVGYQISNTLPTGGHLARIAVHPNSRRKLVGQLLITDLLKRFAQININRVTVNTQSDNHAALALYRQNGFLPTGDHYPVYKLKI